MSERETLTWELFGTAGRELAQMVADDGYRPDIILSIARGGLFVAGALGYALDVKNLHVTNVEFYTGVDERLPMPIMLPPLPNVIDLSGQKVLIADDVADTGATLKLVRDFCAGHVADVRCAVVYEKPHSTVELRVRVAPHVAVDQLPVVHAAAGGPARRPGARRLTSGWRSSWRGCRWRRTWGWVSRPVTGRARACSRPSWAAGWAWPSAL